LTAIKGFLETVETRAEEENRPYLEIIRRNTERMIAIVEDLLVLSELEERGPKIDKTEVDLRPMAESILKMFEKRAKGPRAVLEAPASAIDPGRSGTDRRVALNSSITP
jgi:two-component system phosphate regulon sensor histidine kinase PhoR